MIRQLSSIQGEEAIALMGDLIEPIVEICSNKELANAVRSGKTNKLKIAQMVLKANNHEVMQILSILSDEADYKCNAITILADVMKLLQDKELIDFFTSQVQTEEQTSSASASENIEE